MTSHFSTIKTELLVFKKSLTLGEAITTGIVVLSVSIGFYVSTQVRLNALEMRMQQNETFTQKVDASFEKVNEKLDGIKDQIGTMKVELANKKDKQ